MAWIINAEDIRAGRVPAPFCTAAVPRLCRACGRRAVLPLDAVTRAAQEDGTTHVCHPLIGGCNHGYEETLPYVDNGAKA